ncbi:hypothetical protein Tco_0594160 [Tanacetum coccineum]
MTEWLGLPLLLLALRQSRKVVTSIRPDPRQHLMNHLLREILETMVDEFTVSGILDDFDRKDVIDLYGLVKERYETTSPEGYDLLLWGDLKNLLEPSKEDEIWQNQQDYNLISWRLFDSCGVYVLFMDTGIAIHMMVENTYPLTQEMLSRMLNRRLEVDHESKMAFDLLRFTRSQLQK